MFLGRLRGDLRYELGVMLGADLYYFGAELYTFYIPHFPTQC